MEECRLAGNPHPEVVSADALGALGDGDVAIDATGVGKHTMAVGNVAVGVGNGAMAVGNVAMAVGKVVVGVRHSVVGEGVLAMGV